VNKRWIAVFAVSACLIFAPSQSHARVAEVVLKCTRSLSVAIACVILDRGIEKVVEVGLDGLIDLAFGRKKELKPEDTRPSAAKVTDVEANGIEWSKLREFLLSTFKSEAPVDDAQAREKVAASCNENYVPVCRYLGIPEPRQVVDCSMITTQEACDVTFACSWKSSSCSKHGGTKEQLGR
jgi:hypothetical protein